jgi:quercetin dioxygenase-like cupin family protein
MEIQPRQPTVKAGTDNFTGDVWFDVIARGEEPSRVRVNVVRFAPGARNAWHAHAVGQTIHVTEGLGRIQARGGEVIEIRAGDTVHMPPAEWHWHGAAPDHFMTPSRSGRRPQTDQRANGAIRSPTTSTSHVRRGRTDERLDRRRARAHRPGR